MDENEQSNVDAVNNEEPVLEEIEDTEEPVVEAPKKEFTLEQKLARVSRMKAKLERELGIEPKTEPKVDSKTESSGTTSGLDETQLDYLDLKGISDPDEIEIVQRVMKNTGQTVRQALKDDYVQAKLDKLRAEKAVKDATPSTTKRGGNQVNDLNAAIARFDATGELPTDFELRSAVVNAKYDRSDVTKPSWKR